MTKKSQALNWPLLYLTQRNHLERFRLSHRRTLAVSYTRFAWAGGTFFPVVLLCCVSVWFLREQGFWSTVCLLGVRFWRLRPEKKDTVVCLTGCAVVLFFVVAGNFDYDRKKKDTVVCLAGAHNRKKKIVTTGKKKSSSRLSGGCVSFWFWREIGSFFVVAGNFHYDRKKKSSSRLSGGYVSFWFWREIGSFFVVAGKFYYYRNKKKIHSSVWRVRDKFVLVLVKIDLIHFEHSICISSTWIKTNTNPLVQLQHVRYI